MLINVALVVLLALATLFAGACSRADVARAPIPAAHAWLAEVAARHRAADALLDRGETAAARRELLSVLEAGDAARSEDGRRVLQDTCYRLARLDLDAGDARSALARAERGLGLGRAPDLFVANLLVARGAAHEALGDARAAAADYSAALVINDDLLQLLQGDMERPW